MPYERLVSWLQLPILTREVQYKAVSGKSVTNISKTVSYIWNPSHITHTLQCVKTNYPVTEKSTGNPA